MSLCDTHARLAKYAAFLAKRKVTATEEEARYIDMLGVDISVGVIALETVINVAAYVNQEESRCCEGYGLEYCSGYKKALEDVRAVMAETVDGDEDV